MWALAPSRIEQLGTPFPILHCRRAGRNVAGTPMCGMTINGKDRAAYIKWQLNDNGVFIHISKSGWDIPPGKKMPFALSFDRTGRSEGIASTVTGNRQMIEAIILNDGDGLTFEQFMNYFMKAEKMFFSFPGGSENDWWITLDGSETIGRRFMQCIVEYSDRYGNKKPTQPYGSGATQPHSSNGGGTQPHSGGGNSGITAPPKNGPPTDRFAPPNSDRDRI
jgi:hypothetical protein